MFPYTFLSHHLGFSLEREDVNRKVELGDYEGAKIQLEELIATQEESYGNNFEERKEQYGENIIMTHALRHLEAVIDDNDPEYFDSTTGELKHQSDIVKSSLEREPKTDYS